MGPVVAQNVTVSTPASSPFQQRPHRKPGMLEKTVPSTTCDLLKSSNLPLYQKRILSRNCSTPPLDFSITVKENVACPLDFSLHPSSAQTSPLCEPYKRRSITPPIERYQRMSISQSSTSSICTGSCTSGSESTHNLTSSSTECEETPSSEVDSSPTYCSTSSSSSSSLQTCAFSSPSKSIASTNKPRRYLPLSPNYSPSTYPRKLFYEDYSPLSPRCCSSSTISVSSQHSSSSPNSSFTLPNYSVSTVKQKPPTIDYFLTSPQSPVYLNSSFLYSPFSLSDVRISPISNDNTQRSPTFIDHSPISPVCTPPSSYRPISPDYSPSLMTYFHSPESPKKNKAATFGQYTCNSSICPFGKNSTDNYQNSTGYFPQSFPYIENRSSRYRCTSPNYYALSPEYIPSIYNGNIPEDIPCICCSPSPSMY